MFTANLAIASERPELVAGDFTVSCAVFSSQNNSIFISDELLLVIGSERSLEGSIVIACIVADFLK